MDGSKLFAKDNDNWEGLLPTEKVYTGSDYIGMDLASVQKQHLKEED